MAGLSDAILEELLTATKGLSTTMEKIKKIAEDEEKERKKNGGPPASSADKGKDFVKSLGEYTTSVRSVNVIFGALQLASSAVASALSLLGSVIGKVVTGMGNTVVGLLEFAKAASEGKASIAGFLAAFKDLPFFFGDVFAVMSNVSGILETFANSWRKANDVGASFGGSLVEMRASAALTSLGLEEFVEKTRKFSDILATAPGGIQAGVKKFVDIQSRLSSPGGAYYEGLNTLGIEAAEAADLLGIFMNSQGSLNKKSLQNNDVIASNVAKFAAEVDLYSRAMGKSRKEVEAGMEKVNSDEIFKGFMDTISDPKIKGQITMALEDLARYGPEVQDWFKNIIATGGEITAPLTEAAQKINFASNNAMEDMLVGLRSFVLGTHNAEGEFTRGLIKNQIDMGRAYKQTQDAFQGIASPLRMAGDAAAGFVANENLARIARLTEGKSVEDIIAINQEEAKKRGDAQDIIAKQNELMRWGNQILLKFVTALEPYIPRIMGLVDSLLNLLLPANKINSGFTLLADGIDFMITFLNDMIGTFQNPEEFAKTVMWYAIDGLNWLWLYMRPVVAMLWNSMLPWMVSAWNTIMQGLYNFMIQDMKENGPTKKLNEFFSEVWSGFKGLIYGALLAVLAAIVAFFAPVLLPALGIEFTAVAAGEMAAGASLLQKIGPLLGGLIGVGVGHVSPVDLSNVPKSLQRDLTNNPLPKMDTLPGDNWAELINKNKVFSGADENWHPASAWRPGDTENNSDQHLRSISNNSEESIRLQRQTNAELRRLSGILSDNALIYTD